MNKKQVGTRLFVLVELVVNEPNGVAVQHCHNDFSFINEIRDAKAFRVIGAKKDGDDKIYYSWTWDDPVDREKVTFELPSTPLL